MKFENTIQRVIGLGFHSSVNEDVDHDAWSARTDCPVNDCGKYIESKLSSMGSTLHVCVKEEEWELFIDESLMKKITNSNARSFCSDIPGDRGAQRNVRSEFRLHSRL